MDNIPVLKEFCQFAIESSGLIDAVSVKMGSGQLELVSQTRTQKIVISDQGYEVSDNGEHIGLWTTQVNLAELAAFVVSWHVKDALLQAINDEYKNKEH